MAEVKNRPDWAVRAADVVTRLSGKDRQASIVLIRCCQASMDVVKRGTSDDIEGMLRRKVRQITGREIPQEGAKAFWRSNEGREALSSLSPRPKRAVK